MSANGYLEVMMGPPRKAILSMVFPFFLAAAIVQINSLVDTFWISGLGTTAGSAISTVFPIYGLLTCAGIGLGVGATTTIAFRLGRKDPEGASRLAGQSFTLAILCAALTSVVLFALYDPFIDLLNAGDVRSEGMEYMLPYFLLSPVLLCEAVIGAVLRGEGAARRSTIVQVSAAIFNMIIDPIFIYGLGWGLSGAALATCVSAALALVMGLSWYVRRETVLRLHLRDLRINRNDALEVLEVGGPRTGQSAISNFIDLIQRIFLVIAGGTTGIMLYNFTWRYILLVELPSSAFDTAMIPVCSAAYGRGDRDAVRDGFRYVLRNALIIAFVFTAVIFVFAGPLVSILTYEASMAALKEEFTWTLRVSAFLLPSVALIGVGSSMMQVMKRSKVPMYFNIVWGVAKLGMYAVACTISFHAVIYAMIIIHVIGGLVMIAMALREYRRKFPETPFFSKTST